MAPKLFLFMYTLLLSFHGISSSDSIKYKVINGVPKTPGGIKFTEEIGISYTQELLPKITNFIWSIIFQQNNLSDRKPLDAIEVFISDQMKVGGSLGIPWGNNKININSKYIQEFKGDDLKWHFTGAMYHEVTHLLQWNKDILPGSLKQGIAEYTELKANYVVPNYTKPGEGNSWDQGSSINCRFLEYCDGVVPGFVAKLNKKIRTKYDVSFFK
uniref:uncharacterized protein LOC122596846 n=1 Tax=Erigeron canadensis TaxID=72917 RepID=UPI001CB8E3AC|nr:uncharacterized protein LOC122596846 [Erigeron canadensis]